MTAILSNVAGRHAVTALVATAWLCGACTSDGEIGGGPEDSGAIAPMGGGTGAGGGDGTQDDAGSPDIQPTGGGEGPVGGGGAGGICANGALNRGDICDPDNHCCDTDLTCQAVSPTTALCVGLCDAFLPTRETGCVERELCIADENLAVPDAVEPGFCLPGDECEPDDRVTCPVDSNGSCAVAPPISFCLPAGRIGAGGACALTEDLDAAQLCESGLVCMYGRCKTLCDADGNCPEGAECIDYGPRLDGLDYRFCHDESCDYFDEAGCGEDQVCLAVDERVDETVVTRCLDIGEMQAPGEKVHGETCTPNMQTDWADCRQNHMCARLGESDPTTCFGFCDAENQTLCGEHSSCVLGLIERRRIGVCLGNCAPLADETGCPEGQVCNIGLFVGTSQDGEPQPIGFCGPGDQTRQPGESCTLDATTGAQTCVNGSLCLPTENRADSPRLCVEICDTVEGGGFNAGCERGFTCQTGIFRTDPQFSAAVSDRFGLCFPDPQ